MKYFFSICLLSLLLACDNDETKELNFNEDFVNSYHLRGDMVFYESGQVVETINLDESQEPTFGSFIHDGASGLLSNFSYGLEIYVGVPSNESNNSFNSLINYKEFPNIFLDENYSMIPNSSFNEFGKEFFGATYFYEGSDKNYYYSVGKESKFNLLAMYLGKESIFKGDNGNEDVAIFVGNFSAILKPILVEENDIDHIPDSIQLNASSVKGFLHNGI